MKKLILITLLMLSLTISELSVFAQSAPPPPPDHGLSTDQAPGGGAPVGEGLLILLGLAGTYGGIKGYRYYFKKEK